MADEDTVGHERPAGDRGGNRAGETGLNEAEKEMAVSLRDADHRHASKLAWGCPWSVPRATRNQAKLRARTNDVKDGQKLHFSNDRNLHTN